MTDTGAGRARAVQASVLTALCAIAVLLAGAVPASAHDGTTAAIALRLDDGRVLGTAPVAFAELGLQDTSADGLLDAEELRAQQSAVAATLVATVRDRVQLRVDGDDVAVVGAGLPSGGATDSGSPWVEVAFLSEPHDGDVSRLGLGWSFTSPSDEVALTRTDGVVVGRLAEAGTVTFSLDAPATLSSFFALGVDHIRSGADHLLFLVVLTLAAVRAAPTRASTGRVAALVTAFTLGHAVSLALAWFDVVSVPAGMVEPAIALSIVAAAVVAVRGRPRDARPWIAGGVGLVHGLGFASSLAGLGVATAQTVPALAAFNVGVDVAQTLVVLLVTAALWACTRALPDRGVRTVRVAVCVAAGGVGLVWAVSRVLS